MIKSRIARASSTVSQKNSRKSALALAIAQVAAGTVGLTAIGSPALAASYFWDTNTTTAGTGTTGGTWNAANTNWTLDSSGVAATGVWLNDGTSTAVFSAGTNATGAFTVTVSGTQAVNGITTEEGTVTLAGGTLDFGANPINLTAATPLTINSIITGTNGSFTSSGTVKLTGNNSFSGNATVSTGTLIINNNNAVGTSAINITQGASLQLDGSASSLTISDPITVNGGVAAVVRGAVVVPAKTDDMAFPTAFIGAIDNRFGNNTITGTITLAGIQNNIGQLGLNTISVGTYTAPGVANSSSLTVTNNMAITSGTSLAKTGPGTLILQGSAAYPILTRLFGGTLVAQADGALGANAAGSLGILQLQGTDSTFALQAPVGSGGFTYNASNQLFNNYSFTMGGWGHGNLGAMDNLGGDNTYVGNISLSAPGSLSTSTGDLAQTYIGVQAGSLTIQGLAGAGSERAVTKVGTGNLIFNGKLNVYGPFEIAQGTVTFGTSGDGNSVGTFASPTPIITWLNVNNGTTLALDNTNNAYSLSGNGANQSPIQLNIPVNLFGGELKLVGCGFSPTFMDFTTPGSYGIVNPFGMPTFTTVANGSTTTIITPARANQNTFLIRGMGDGLNQITIGGSPALVGGGGGANDPSISILPFAIGDASATGSGTDLVTFDSGLNSYRVLSASEYATLTNGNSAVVNAKTSGIILSSPTSVNSLKLTAAAVNVGAGNTLSIGSGAVLATGGASTISGGTLAMGGAEGVISAVAGSSLNISSPITGTNGLTLSGGGTVTLAGNNPFTGGLTLNSGTLSFSNDNNLGDAAGTVSLGGGVFKPASSLASLSRNVLIVGRASIDLDAGQTFTLSGNLTSPTTGNMSGALTKTGSGTLVLTGSNTYAGGTNVLGGILSVNSADAYPKGSGNGFAPMTLDGGTLQFTGGGTIVLSGAGTDGTPYGIQLGKNNGTIDVATGTLVQWGANQTSATAPMYGPGALIKTGGGTWEFLGNSPNYNGGTFINGGTLQVDLAGTLPSAGGVIEFPFIQINNTGRLALNNFSMATSDLYINNGGTLVGLGAAGYAGKVATFGPQIGDGANVTLLAPSATDILTISGALGNQGTTATPTVNIDGAGTVYFTAAQLATFKGNFVVKNGATFRLGSSSTATAVLGATTNTLTVDTTGGTIQPRIGANRTYGPNAVTLNGPTTFNLQSTTADGAGAFVSTFGTLKVNNNQPIAVTFNGAGTGNNGIISGTLGGVAFGATTLAGSPTFDVANPVDAAGAVGRVTLGKITESGGSRSITKNGAGDLTLGGTASAITGTLTDNAGSVTVTGTTSIGRLVETAGTVTVSGTTSKLTLAANGATASVLTSLPTFGSTAGTTPEFDTTNNKVVIDYTGPTLASSLRTMLATGANFTGNSVGWNGTGIVSATAKGVATTAVAGGGIGYTGIGYLESSSLFGPSGGTFGGVAADGTALLLKYTYFGDVNLDGIVNADDYALLDKGFNQYTAGTITASSAVWQNGDFNYDGAVTSTDYLLADTGYAKQAGPLSPGFLASREAQFGEAYVSQLIAAVPEPTSLGLIGMGAMAIIGRRRRQQS